MEEAAAAAGGCPPVEEAAAEGTWPCACGCEGGLEELAVELPGLLECLLPVLLHASSLRRQQLYNLGLLGDMVICGLMEAT